MATIICLPCFLPSFLPRPRWCNNSRGALLTLACNMSSEEALPRMGARSRRLQKRRRAKDMLDSHSTNDIAPKEIGELVQFKHRGDLVHLQKVVGNKALTAADQVKLAQGVQDLLLLDAVKSRLEKRLGRAPSLAEWARAMGMEPTALSQRHKYGSSCWNAMMRNNLRLVIYISNKYHGRGLSSQDLVQEGTKGLLEACARFEPAKGFKFSTYANYWIVAMIQKACAKQSKSLRLPDHIFNGLQTVWKTRREIREANKETSSETDDHDLVQKEYGLADFATQIGFSEKMSQMLLQLSKRCSSLHEPISTGENLMDMLDDTNIESPEATAYKQLLRSDIQKALSTLKPRDAEILRLRYGLEDGQCKSLQEVGDILGLTRERIRQIESRAFRQFRNQDATNTLKGYIDESIIT